MLGFNVKTAIQTQSRKGKSSDWLLVHERQCAPTQCADKGNKHRLHLQIYAHTLCANFMVNIMLKHKEVKKPANLSLDQGLLREARELGINLSGAAEDGLRSAIAREKSERWKRENASAIASSNKWVEEHGLPLAAYRRF